MTKKISFGRRFGAAWQFFKSAGSVTHPADLAGMLELLLHSHQAVSGAKVNPATAMRVAAVFACINVISETLGTMPITVYKRLPKGREAAPDHPLARVLKQPNPWQNRMEFIEMLAAHTCLRGNGYALKVMYDLGGGRRGVRELLPLHPDAVRVEIQPDKLPIYFWRPTESNGGFSTREIPIPWENILHVRYKSLNGYTGLSPISVARDVVGMGITLQDHTGNLFKRGAHTGGVLQHPDTLTDEVAKRVRESWQETYGGAQNAGKVVVLEEGMTYSAVGMSMADAQYIETRKLNRVEIASIYRVPPAKINAADKVSYNTMEQAAIEFITDCMLGWAVRFELTLDRDLVEAGDTYFVKFNMNMHLRGDIKTRFDAYRVGREGGWLSPNDVRDLEDMNPIPAEQGGDSYMQPVNMGPLGAKPAAKPPSTEVPPSKMVEAFAEAIKLLKGPEETPLEVLSAPPVLVNNYTVDKVTVLPGTKIVPIRDPKSGLVKEYHNVPIEGGK
jgi:HK97 family phage portal protein